MDVWWTDETSIKVTTNIVLLVVLIEFILNFANVLFDWKMWPEYSLCMKNKHPESVTWAFWDAIVIIYIVLIICVIIWDFTSYRMVRKWADSQDPSLSIHLSTKERHLKNEPQMKSTIINALVLFFYGIYAAIPFETLTFDAVFLIYQSGTIIFLPLILIWNHEITKANKRTDSEHERELRRHLEYEEARERRAKIEAKRAQRKEELTIEMEHFESVRVQALKG